MIIVKFQGRLGNQIFQYAFGLTNAIKFKTVLLIDKSNTHNSFFKYFKTNSIASISFVNDKLVNHFTKRYKEVFQTGNDSVESIKNKIANKVYYEGFFQSEQYFDALKSDISERLILKKRYRKLFDKKYGKLFKEHKVLAIHCRLGDYIEWGSEELGGKNLSLPETYYFNCLKKIKELQSYKVIIVTDDIENIKNRFNFIKDKIIVSNEEIIDFQILQNAHKLIISNSSFSWWGAYLNNKSATIYAPQYWLGFKVEKEYPVSIIPNSWVKINCYEE